VSFPKKKAQLPLISPTKFTWELYIGRQGYSTTEVVDEDENFKPGVHVIGYCDAGNIEIRPRPGLMVAMVELENGTKMWLHLNKFA
jgi:hypothetical protein